VELEELRLHAGLIIAAPPNLPAAALERLAATRLRAVRARGFLSSWAGHAARRWYFAVKSVQPGLGPVRDQPRHCEKDSETGARVAVTDVPRASVARPVHKP
jgi:hypothetical protein